MLSDQPLWIFGYGSLVWRVDFPHVEVQPAYIEGWARRFWQGSPDHRGYPHRPGRVVTLIQEPDTICWGHAYRIAQNQTAAVLDHLDYREQGGYDRVDIDIHLASGETVQGLTYHATNENEHFLGDASARDIAEHIMSAQGPSGTNLEYLLELAAALRNMNRADPHIEEILIHIEMDAQIQRSS